MLNKIYSFMGLATKAGKVMSGESVCERLLKTEKSQVHLVIVAENASENTRKRFTDMCKYREIEIRFFGEKESIGRYTGKDIRSVVAILDQGFAKRLIEMLDGSGLEYGGGRIVKG